MSKDMNSHSDVRAYLEASQPHDSPQAANAEWRAFLEEVRDARLKHRIADVVIGASFTVRYEDGALGTPMACANMGTAGMASMLSAYALGVFQAEDRARIAKAIQGPAREHDQT